MLIQHELRISRTRVDSQNEPTDGVHMSGDGRHAAACCLWGQAVQMLSPSRARQRAGTRQCDPVVSPGCASIDASNDNQTAPGDIGQKVEIANLPMKTTLKDQRKTAGFRLSRISPSYILCQRSFNLTHPFLFLSSLRGNPLGSPWRAVSADPGFCCNAY